MATLTLKRPEAYTSSIPTENGWYTCTPEMAFEWQDTNINARHISITTVAQYARDMKTGHWEENGEPMMFDEDGKLINGFHRSRACIAAETPFRTYVIVGLPRGTKIFDLGWKRTHGQVLTLKGERYGIHLGTVTRLLWKYERGPRVLLDGSARPTLQEVFEMLEKHPEIRTSTEYVVGSCGKAGRLSGTSSIPILIHYLGSKNHGDKADHFIELIHKGVEPASNNPAYKLRERLIEWQKLRVKATRAEYLGLWIPAWNSFARGKAMRTLRPVDWRGEALGSQIE